MEMLENKRLVAIDGGCQYEAHRPYGLWDMISFLADGLFWPLFWLEHCKQQAEKKLAESGPGSRLSRQESELIWRQLGLLKPVCDELGLVTADSYATNLTVLVVAGNVLAECSVVAASIKALVSAVHSEVNRLQFAFIPPDKAEYFEKHDLFGEAVSAAFPSAQPEIKDAGNCLAADLNTAAVFHLMRAVEHGLRALARHLKVRVGQPLQYACWERVIRAIDQKLDKLRLKPRGAKKSAELELYDQLLNECDYFKEAWRNPVSHARRRYSEAEAMSAFGHVRDFMKKLAERVKESN